MDNLQTGTAVKRPSGTVTFLFTDIEQSSKLWQGYPDRMNVNVALHDRILRSAIEANDGYVFKTVGDAFYAAFHTAHQALQATLDSQKGLVQENWGNAQIKVRMGLHTGDTNERDNDYFGPTLSVVARLMSAGHGGQILVSRATADLLQGKLPEQVALLDLGEHRLKDIFDLVHIFQVKAPGLPTTFPPLRTMGLVNNNLPVHLTSFIGREKEIGEIQQALASQRMVTLNGPGGAGKTRLSLQVAGNLQGQFEDGEWLIELAPLSEADRIPQAFLSVFGLPDQKNRESIEVLLDYLKDKHLLIVLDNCEHVIVESAKLANAILSAAPRVKILATSREVLGVAGEKVYRVPSMDSPDPENLPDLETMLRYESIQLFVERAQATSSDFQLTMQTAPAIAKICRRLDGIPFAIELAAALVDEMSPKTIATHLDDRFNLLVNRARNLSSRHLTLGALIDWSYDRLTDAEQALLRRLSVFSNGWSLEGAESICADAEGLIPPKYVLPLLGRLIKKALVLYSINTDRYDMLETIRLYAVDKHNQEAEMVASIHQRQVEYYLDFLRQHRNSFLLIESERANLVSAYNACMKNNPGSLAEFSNLMCDVLIARGYFRDGIYLFSSGLQAVDAQKQPEVAAILNHNLGRCYFEIADEEKAKELFNLSLSTTSDPLMQANNYLYLAAVYVDQEENATAFELIEKSRALYAALGHQKGLAEANYWEAFLNYYGDDILKVQGLLTSALDMFKKAGDGWGKLQCMHLLCYAFIAKNNPLRNKPAHLARAEQMVEAALALSESLGELNFRASLFRASAEITAMQGAYDASYHRALEGLNLAAKSEDKKLQAQIVKHLFRIFVDQGKYAEGIEWGNKVLLILDGMEDVRIRASVLELFCLAYRGLNDFPAARRAGLESRDLFGKLNDHLQFQEVDRLLESLA